MTVIRTYDICNSKIDSSEINTEHIFLPRRFKIMEYRFFPFPRDWKEIDICDSCLNEIVTKTLDKNNTEKETI